MDDQCYVVIGYQNDITTGANNVNSLFLGTFSTEEFARAYGDRLLATMPSLLKYKIYPSIIDELCTNYNFKYIQIGTLGIKGI